MSRVIIVHRWDGDSESDWIPWLKEELERRGIIVTAPDMPDSAHPKIETWVPFLSGAAGDVDEETYFVGHSVGCQAILRYLASLPAGKRVGGAVFVAAWGTTPEKDAVMVDFERPWIETPIDWNAVASHSSSFVYIYSDKDPWVPEENAQLFKEKLNAKLVLVEGKGHFTENEDDVTQLPELLDELLPIMGLPVETKLI